MNQKTSIMKDFVKLLKEKIIELGRPEYLSVNNVYWDEDDDHEWVLFGVSLEYYGDEIEEIELQFCTERSRNDGFEESLFAYEEAQQQWFAEEIINNLN